MRPCILARPVPIHLPLLAVFALAACNSGHLPAPPAECTYVSGDHRELVDLPCPDPIARDRQLVCGVLKLAEDPARERSCLLSIAWVRYEPEEPSDEPPVFALAGGPASGIVGRSDELAALARSVAPGRTWVWHDPRGVGASRPRLDCADAPAGAGGDVGKGLAACAQAYRAAGHRAARYRTEVLAGDVVELAEALGAERIDAFGASYGSRLGYALASLYPERVRALVLDAAVPLDASILEAPVERYLQSMERIAEDCAAVAACARAYGDVAALHAANLERLREGPLELDVLGEVLELSPEIYIALTGSLAASTRVGRVPAFVSAVARGEAEAAERALGTLPVTSPDVWVNSAIQCAEELPQADRARAASDLERLPSFAPRTYYDVYLAHCEALDMLPGPAAEPAWRGVVAPLEDDLPVLALNGRYDPLTSAADWSTSEFRLPEGSLFTVPDAGHAARNSRCGTALVTQFLAAPRNGLALPEAECTPDPELFTADDS